MGVGSGAWESQGLPAAFSSAIAIAICRGHWHCHCHFLRASPLPPPFRAIHCHCYRNASGLALGQWNLPPTSLLSCSWAHLARGARLHSRRDATTLTRAGRVTLRGRRCGCVQLDLLYAPSWPPRESAIWVGAAVARARLGKRPIALMARRLIGLGTCWPLAPRPRRRMRAPREFRHRDSTSAHATCSEMRVQHCIAMTRQCTSSVTASYKPPMLVTRARLPAGAMNFRAKADSHSGLCSSGASATKYTHTARQRPAELTTTFCAHHAR